MNIRNALYRAGIETGGADIEIPSKDLVVTAGGIDVTAGDLSVVAGLVNALGGFSSNAGTSGLKINVLKKTAWSSAATSSARMTSGVNSLLAVWGNGHAALATVTSGGACTSLARTASAGVSTSATGLITISDDGGEAVIKNRLKAGNYSIVEFILS